MSGKHPTPPTKPRYRSVASAAKNIQVLPYFLRGDADKIAACMEKEPPDIKSLLEDHEVVCVGVRRLLAADYLEYENLYGRSLNLAVNSVLYVFYAGAKMVQPEMDDNPLPEFDMDASQQRFVTPFGNVYGSLEKNILILMGFLLSRCGRIIGVDSGEYEFDPFTEHDVMQTLDPGVCQMFFEDGKSVFFDVLELSGCYDPEETAARLKEQGIVAEDEAIDKSMFPDLPANEVGNSASPSDENSSTDKDF